MSVQLAEPIKAAPPAAQRGITAAAHQFCIREGLAHALDTALDLLRLHFGAGAVGSVELAHDPDSDDKWLAARVTFRGSPLDFGARRRQFTREWIARTDSDTRYKIRLSYGII